MTGIPDITLFLGMSVAIEVNDRADEVSPRVPMELNLPGSSSTFQTILFPGRVIVARWVALAILRVNVGMIKILGDGGILLGAFLVVAGIVIYNMIPNPKDPPPK